MIVKGSHLDGVEPINEKEIKTDELLKIFQSKISKKYFNYLKRIVSNKKIFDKSGYSGNSILICKGINKSYVIKISTKGNLVNEYIAAKFFNRYKLTSKPIKYFKSNNYEFFVSQFIDLPTAGYYFDSYQSIATYFGKKLKEYHDLGFSKSLFNKEELTLFEKKYDENLEKALNSDNGLIYMKIYLEEEDILKMKKYLIDNRKMLHKNEILVHGDFNPNNVFIKENQRILLIDFCDSGLCNKHYDIFWTMFMIIIFSGILKEKEKIKECENLFLEAYGKENINLDELLYFKYYSCLYWKRHDEITRIDNL